MKRTNRPIAKTAVTAAACLALAFQSAGTEAGGTKNFSMNSMSAGRTAALRTSAHTSSQMGGISKGRLVSNTNLGGAKNFNAVHLSDSMKGKGLGQIQRAGGNSSILKKGNLPPFMGGGTNLLEKSKAKINPDLVSKINPILPGTGGGSTGKTPQIPGLGDKIKDKINPIDPGIGNGASGNPPDEHCDADHHCHHAHWDVAVCEPFFHTHCWHPEQACYVVWVYRSGSWCQVSAPDLTALSTETPVEFIAISEPVPYEYEETLSDGTVVNKSGVWWIGGDGLPHGQENWAATNLGPQVAAGLQTNGTAPVQP